MNTYENSDLDSVQIVTLEVLEPGDLVPCEVPGDFVPGPKCSCCPLPLLQPCLRVPSLFRYMDEGIPSPFCFVPRGKKGKLQKIKNKNEINLK